MNNHKKEVKLIMVVVVLYIVEEWAHCRSHILKIIKHHILLYSNGSNRFFLVKFYSDVLPISILQRLKLPCAVQALRSERKSFEGHETSCRTGSYIKTKTIGHFGKNFLINLHMDCRIFCTYFEIIRRHKKDTKNVFWLQ